MDNPYQAGHYLRRRKLFREQLPGLVILLSLIAEAAVGGVVVTTFPWPAPVLMLVTLMATIIAALFLHHRQNNRT
ncbi:hypothetical protein RCG67_13790 [Kocuria sp. CPCC 205292]|uniref:hypothetical protein n=1 Tax=Kocuria cellulosilytica TaxID=3071451 RepID=UPI0034D59AEE